MTSVRGLLNDDPKGFLEMEPEELAGHLLVELQREDRRRSNQLNIHNFTNGLGADATEVIAEAWSYLQREGLIAERSAGSGDKGDIWAGSSWTFSVNSLYQVAADKPWGFNLGGSLTGREGFVSPPYVTVPGFGRRAQLAPFDQFRNWSKHVSMTSFIDGTSTSSKYMSSSAWWLGT